MDTRRPEDSCLGQGAEDLWKEIFSKPKEKGLQGIDLALSDDHRGLVKVK